MTRKRIQIPVEVIEAYLGRCSETATAPRVSKLAVQLGISRVTLNIRFQELTGMPLSDYCSTRREQLAAELLSESNLNTEGVAARAGFGTSRTFQRVFARITGLEIETPTGSISFNDLAALPSLTGATAITTGEFDAVSGASPTDCSSTSLRTCCSAR